MKIPPILALVTSLATLANVASTQAATETDTNLIGTLFTVSSTDLLQTNLASTTPVGGFTVDTGGGPGVLTDGGFGTAGGTPAGATGFATAGGSTAGGEGQSIVFSLDLTSSPTGYSISKIDTYAGGDAYRVSQEYTVSYSTVLAPTNFITLATVNDDYTAGTDGGNYGNHDSMVDLADPTTGLLASGVADIQFVFADSPSTDAIPAAGYNNYREIDVFGTAIPEPGTSALAVGGLVGLVGLRRRRV